MNKELEALERIVKHGKIDRFDTYLAHFSEDCENIKSALERLEKVEKIFKKYAVLDLVMVKNSKTYEEYIEIFKALYWEPDEEYENMFDKDDFNLLKEMLK